VSDVFLNMQMKTPSYFDDADKDGEAEKSEEKSE